MYCVDDRGKQISSYSNDASNTCPENVVLRRRGLVQEFGGLNRINPYTKEDWIREIERRERLRFKRYGTVIGWWDEPHRL